MNGYDMVRFEINPWRGQYPEYQRSTVRLNEAEYVFVFVGSIA